MAKDQYLKALYSFALSAESVAIRDAFYRGAYSVNKLIFPRRPIRDV